MNGVTTEDSEYRLAQMRDLNSNEEIICTFVANRVGRRRLGYFGNDNTEKERYSD